MAVVKMRKLTLIGYGAQKEQMLRLLHRTGEVEIVRSADYENTAHIDETSSKEDLRSRLAGIEFALSFLEEQKRIVKALDKERKTKTEIQGKSGLFSAEHIMCYDDFVSIIDKESELQGVVTTLEKYSQRLGELRSITQRTKARIDSVTPYEVIPYRMSQLKDTVYTKCIIGTMPNSKATLVKEELAKFEGAECNIYDGEPAVITAVVLKDVAGDLLSLLQSYDFSEYKPDFSSSVSEEISKLTGQLVAVKEEEENIAYACVEYNSYLLSLKTLYDFYTVSYGMCEAKEDFASTRTTYILSGWIRADKEEEIIKTIQDSGLVYEVDVRDPVDTDEVPTALKNNGFVAPFESVTNMFSVPNYRERDPNPVMSIFYFIFFGLMISDAGYGLMLLIGGLLANKFIKTRDGGKLFKILTFGGASTLVWGILFGSYFGIEVPQSMIILFSPLDEPLNMFILALALGVLQIMAGILLKGIALVRDGKVFDAICDSFSWLCVFIGAIFFVLGMVGADIVGENMVGTFSTVGIVFVLVGFGLILLFAGRKKPSVVGKIIGGFGGLYGTINYVSDLFSYARLFGLGLATSAICTVFNQMAGVVSGLIPGVGVVAGALIIVVGHLFNIAINTLGAYVHNNRLQFVEFFGKFYEGDGKLFTPFASQTKYIIINKK